MTSVGESLEAEWFTLGDLFCVPVDAVVSPGAMQLLSHTPARPSARRGIQHRKQATSAIHHDRDGHEGRRDTLLGNALEQQNPPRGLVRGALHWLGAAMLAPVHRLVNIAQGFIHTRDSRPERRADAARAKLRNALLINGLRRIRLAFPEMQETRTRHHGPGVGDGVPFSSLDGAITGRVRTFGGGPIAHATTAEMWCRSRHFGAMRLDAFLDATVPSPHLLLHLNVLPSGTVLFYFDLQPRVDLRADDAYLARYYLAHPPGCQRSPADLVAACLNDRRLRPFVSRDGVVRVFMATPAALLFTVDADAEGVAQLEAVMHEVLSQWLAMATMPRGTKVDATAVRQRDRVTRLFVQRDPDTANMRPLLGKDTTDMLVELLSGYNTADA